MSSLVRLDRKPERYYGRVRDELIAGLPRPLGRVLDVGCAEGAGADTLRSAGAEWISGIEINDAAAARAAERYDEVVARNVIDALDGVTGPFDTILCYDVLEHLVDPGGVLLRLEDVAAPGARLHVSVPNARYFSAAYDLLVRGTFGYASEGIRDATHLRWFTRRDIVALLEATGWPVVTTSGAYGPRVARALRVTRGLGIEFVAVQWTVLAQLPRAA